MLTGPGRSGCSAAGDGGLPERLLAFHLLGSGTGLGPSGRSAGWAALFLVAGPRPAYAEPMVTPSPSTARRSGADLGIYAVSGVFAFVTAHVSTLPAYQVWAHRSQLTYASATVAAFVILIMSRRLSASVSLGLRVLLAMMVFIGAAVAPLFTNVVQRERHGAIYVQDEVITTEQAARDLLAGSSPYSRRPPTEGAEARPFPYLPLMAAFGLPRALLPASAWNDARLAFTATSLIVVFFALTAASRAPPNARLRVFQLLLTAPPAALALATGGDDIVVLALLLLAILLKQSDRHVVSSATICCAALMKATAWPLLLLLAATAHRSPGRWRLRFQPSVGHLLLPAALLPVLVVDGRGLLADTVLFPLGLLPRLSERPPLHLVPLIWSLVLAVAASCCLCLRRLPLLSPTGAAARAGVVTAMLLAVLPAARPGLWVYPISLVAWSMLLRPQPGARPTPSLPLGRQPPT